jgi:hypothetical protein
MTPSQIEGWALVVIDRVTRGQPREDARVELKREWIEPKKAARRLAGHANAAGGEPVLWLIGVDEETGVCGASNEELAKWLPGVQSMFDGIHPTATAVAVPIEQRTVVALLFDTARAPFVIKAAGTADREVPWRDGTHTRSAYRSDLIRILHPYQRLPDVDVVHADAGINSEHLGPGEQDYGSRIQFRLTLYVSPLSPDPLTIPRHRCDARVWLGPDNLTLDHIAIRLLPPPQPKSDFDRSMAMFIMPPGDLDLPTTLSVEATQYETIVRGPGFLVVHGTADTKTLVREALTPLTIEVEMRPVLTSAPLLISASLTPPLVPSDLWWESGRQHVRMF